MLYRHLLARHSSAHAAGHPCAAPTRPGTHPSAAPARPWSARLAAVWVLASGALLSACGGGGGGGSSPFNPSFPLQVAGTRLLTTAASFSASGSSPAGTVSVQLTHTPLADASFNGSLRKVLQQTVRFSLAGSLIESGSSQLYFSTSPLQLVGEVDLEDGSTVLFSNEGNLPTEAKVGDSGALYRYSTTDPDNPSATISGTGRWSLDAVSGNTNSAYLCIKTVETTSGVSGSFSQDQCFLINTAGEASGLLLRGTVDGLTLELR